MFFNSIEYIIFLPLVLMAFLLSGQKLKWIVLMFANLLFVAFIKIEWGILMGAYIIFTYFFAIQIENENKKANKRVFLTLNLFAVLLPLIVLRYFDLISLSTMNSFAFIGFKFDFPILNIVLPAGLLFYCLHSISYSIEVYRGNYKAEKNIAKLAAYIGFFPLMLLGPVERFKSFKFNVHTSKPKAGANLERAITYLLYGLFIKMVLADNLATFTNQVFSNSADYNRSHNLLAILLFNIQVYANFYAFYIIARGSTLLFGLKLSENFRSPLFATSINDYLNKWFITLRKWLNDYLLSGMLKADSSLMVKIGGGSILMIAGSLFIKSSALVLFGAVLLFIFFLLESFIFRKLLKIDSAKNSLLSLTGFIYTICITSCFWMLLRFRDLNSFLDYFNNDIFYSGERESFSHDFQVEMWIFLLAFLVLEFFNRKANAERLFFKMPGIIKYIIYLILVVLIFIFAQTEVLQSNYSDLIYE